MSKEKTVEERAEELAKLLEQRVRELKNQSEKKEEAALEALLLEDDIESLRDPQQRGEVLEKFSEESLEKKEARKLEQRVKAEEQAALEALLSEDIDDERESDAIDEASRLQAVQRILVQDADQELADKIKESHELLRGALEDKGSTVTVQKTEAERLAEAKNQSGNIASSLAEIQDPEFKKTLCKEIAGRVKDKDYGFRLSEAEIIFDKLNKDDKKEFFAALKPENQMEFINSGNSLSDDRKIKLFRRVIKEQNKPETSAVMSPQQILKQAKGQQNNRRQQEEPFEISEQNRGLYVTALMQEIARDKSITDSLRDLYDARGKSSSIQFNARDRAADVIASKLKKTDISGLFSGMDEKQEAAFKKEISESIKQATKKTVWQRISSAVKNVAVSMGIIKSRPALSAEEFKTAALEKQSKAIITTAHKAAKQRLSKQESKAKSKVKRPRSKMSSVGSSY